MQEHDDITPAAWEAGIPFAVASLEGHCRNRFGHAGFGDSSCGIVNANTSSSDIVVSTDDANQDEVHLARVATAIPAHTRTMSKMGRQLL